MAKVRARYTDYFAQTIQRMREDGLLLVTQGTDGKPNVMTIGWGTMGVIWSRPIFIVLVRPSRYTYSRLEEISDFTVNVPPRELAAAASHCGTVSGRDHDKWPGLLVAWCVVSVRPLCGILFVSSAISCLHCLSFCWTSSTTPVCAKGR